MKFADFVVREAVIADLKTDTKEGVIRTMVKSLLEAENVPRELSYTIRVSQSVRVAAESVGFTEVAALAEAVEGALAACKSRPEDIRKEHVGVLREAATFLSQKIAALSDPESLRILASLEALTEAMQSPPSVVRVKGAG